MTFDHLHNPTFLQACHGLPTAYTPVWLMRQAGRYLPEYCATRAKAGSFMGLATNRDFATEVTLQPLARYPLDAAILFSDILTVPDAMGLGLSFAQGEGPRFARPVRDEAAVKALRVPDMHKLQYVFDAVSSIRSALTIEGPNGQKQSKVPLIGFSGSPWTLACYMVEGAGSDDYRLVKTMLYARPDLMHQILAVNADAVAVYLNAQIDAGAQAVMVFDSWGGVLADGAFQAFSLAYTRRVLAQLKTTGPEGHAVPRIVFTKGGGPWLKDMKDLPCDVLGLDWTANLAAARSLLGDQKTLQGNIDPNVLFAPPKAIEAEVAKVLAAFGPPQRPGLAENMSIATNASAAFSAMANPTPNTATARRGPAHIFNLGHGISQYTPPEHVAALVAAVHSQSAALRTAA